MSILDKIKKNTTIKDSAILAKSKLFTEKDMENYKVTYRNKKDINPHLYEIVNDMIDMGSSFKCVNADINNLKEISNGKDLQ